jgi:hypothetical protein
MTGLVQRIRDSLVIAALTPIALLVLMLLLLLSPLLLFSKRKLEPPTQITGRSSL